MGTVGMYDTALGTSKAGETVLAPSVCVDIQPAKCGWENMDVLLLEDDLINVRSFFGSVNKILYITHHTI